MKYRWAKPNIQSFSKLFNEASAVAPAPGDDKVYGNRVFIGIFKGLTLFIVRRCLGDIGGKDGVKGN